MSPAPTNTGSPDPPPDVTVIVWVTGVPAPAALDGVRVTAYVPAAAKV
jgi:hypothetical protein